MSKVDVSLANLRIFITKMQSYVDSGQPSCSASTGGDYYVEDALNDLEIIEETFKKRDSKCLN